METQEIQTQIDDAVRIFKETLEKSYLDKKIPLHGIGVHAFNHFLTGKCTQTRLKNGNMKIIGELPAVMFKPDVKGLPLKVSDWNIFPFVITLFQTSEEHLK